MHESLVEARRLATGEKRAHEIQDRVLALANLTAVPGHRKSRQVAWELKPEPALSCLLRLSEDLFTRQARCRNPAELILDSCHGLLGVEITDDDKNGAIGRVVPLVIRHHAIATEALQIFAPTDDRMVIGMHAIGNGLHGLPQGLPGIVIAHLQLLDDDLLLGRELRWIQEAVAHAAGFDLQSLFPAIARQIEVEGRVVLRSHRIVVATKPCGLRVDAALGIAVRPLEHHVLEKMRDPSLPALLVTRTHAIPDPVAHDRKVTALDTKNAQAVLEHYVVNVPEETGRAGAGRLNGAGRVHEN